MSDTADVLQAARDKAAGQSDLQKLVGRGLKITDRHGKEHVLAPLDIDDVAEIENRFGTLDSLQGSHRLQDVFFFLYLSLRKEGRTHNQLRIGDYALTEKEARQLFLIGAAKEIVGSMLDLLEISGLGVRRRVAEAPSDPIVGQAGKAPETTAPASQPSVEEPVSQPAAA